jgi:hypothetical protein
MPYLELLLPATSLADRLLEHLLQFGVQSLVTLLHLNIRCLGRITDCIGEGETMSEPNSCDDIVIAKSDPNAMLRQPPNHLSSAILRSSSDNMKWMAKSVELS